MKTIMTTLIFATTLLTTSCSTTTQSTFLGMGVGVSTGAITSAIHRQDKKKAIISSLAFGLIGAITGFFGHKSLDKRDAEVRKKTIFNLEKFGVQGMPEKSSYIKEKSKEVYIFTDNPQFFE